MPTNTLRQGAYIQGSSPAAVNVTAANDYAPGEIGAVYKDATGTWQKVIMDSGATPAPVVTLLAFWKTRSTYTVTTKLADSTRNEVAGVVMGTVTAGNVCWILIRGASVQVKCTAGAVGDMVVANSGGNADGLQVVAGTAPQYTIVGPVSVAVSAGAVGCDVMLDPQS